MKNKNGGFSLAEVSIAIGISAIVIGGIVSTLSIVNKGNSQYNFIQARNEIASKIRTQALNPKNLIVSSQITSNLGVDGLTPDYDSTSTLGYPNQLQKCIPDVGNKTMYGCDKTTIEEPGRGYLFYLADNANSDPEKTIAGEDVYYKNTGIRCTSSEAANPATCPIIARVWFEPYCLNFANNCNKAMSLAIRYSIGLRSSYKADFEFAELNGEIYVPLQKGIYIRNLLTQSDAPISPNSKGVFVLPKYYGLPGQTVQGLRLEATIANPIGLISMRVQMRAITGTSAKIYDDSKIPPDLNKKTWTDVPTPENPGLGAWSIDLAGASPNESFNFGTQSNVNTDSRPPIAYAIGKSKSGSLDPNFHWTINSDSTDYLPPTFLSGFYQFRIVAKDSTGTEIESSNYITVRLVSTPEFQFVNSNFSLIRDCVNSTIPFSLFIGDDEDISFNLIKLNGDTIITPTIIGNKGLINFNFLSNQTAGNYPITVTLKNHFSDVVMETLTVPKVESTEVIKLTDALVTSTLLNNPDKIRLTYTGTAVANYTAGNCCNATPKSTWSFPSSPFFGGTNLLVENSSGTAADFPSTMTCTVTGGTRSCSTSITVKGIKEGPEMSSPPNNISFLLDLGGEESNPACQFTATKPSGDPVGKYIPIVSLPTIRFYLTESLWLHNIPAGPNTPSTGTSSIKPTTPRVYVRMDFAPLNNIEVYVVDAANTSNILCAPITFVADGGTKPVDKYCDITDSSFSGVLELRRKDDNPLTNYNKIMYQSEASCPFTTCDAKFSGAVHHTICQRSFTNPSETVITKIPMPTQITVPATLSMINSPYGTLSSGAQNTHNDAGVWIVNRKKNLRCYDNWNRNNSARNFYNDPDNKQDYYGVYKYNTEDRLAISPLPEPKHYRLISPSTDWPAGIQFKDFIYPVNGGVIDYAADNVPFFYLVSQAGTPDGGRFTVSTSSTASVNTGTYNWEDVTSSLNCSGLSNNIKFYRIRPNINWSSSTAITDKIIAISTITPDYNDRYSYFFTCDYGRWHPTHDMYNSWTD